MPWDFLFYGDINSVFALFFLAGLLIGSIFIFFVKRAILSFLAAAPLSLVLLLIIAVIYGNGVCHHFGDLTTDIYARAGLQGLAVAISYAFTLMIMGFIPHDEYVGGRFGGGEPQRETLHLDGQKGADAADRPKTR